MDDFDASMFIVISGRQCIPLHEYDETDMEGVFVMLTNDELNSEYGDDNSICIYRDWINLVEEATRHFPEDIRFVAIDNGLTNIKWQTEFREIPETPKLTSEGMRFTQHWDRCMRRYLDGYKTCVDIMTGARRLTPGTSLDGYIPAVMAAYHTVVTFDDKEHHGYLPAIGQLRYISENLLGLNQGLHMLNKKIRLFDYEYNPSSIWWSSTEQGYARAWSFSHKSAYDLKKNAKSQILPLFVL